MKTAALIFCLALLLGCYTVKRAEHDLIKIQTKHPEAAARFARTFYPAIGVRDTIVHSDTAYRFAEISCDTGRIDTVRFTEKQIIYKQAKTKIIAVPAVTIYKDKIVKDTAENLITEMRLQACEEDKQAWITKADNRATKLWWLLIALAISIILNLIQLRK